MGYLLNNWHQRPRLHKQASGVGGLVKDFTGITDMQAGLRSFGEGKVFKGVGQLALGTALGVTTLVPGVGWLAKGGLLGLKGLFTAARGAKAVNSAVKLSKTRHLSSSQKKAFGAGKRHRRAQEVSSGGKKVVTEGKAFNTFMKKNVTYGTPLTGSAYRPDNLLRAAWEVGKTATFGGKQAHAWRSGRGGLNSVGPTMFNKMRIGVNEGNLRTKAGQWAARHPHYANAGLTAGVPVVLAGVGAARYSSPPQQQGFSGFNISPLIAGPHQSPSWLESNWGSPAGQHNNWLR